MIDHLPLGWAIELADAAGGSPSFSYDATPDEREALARYLNIDAVESLKARVRVRALSQGKFKVEGRFEANIRQLSVVNLDPVHSVLNEDFSVEYWPADLMPEDDGEEVSLNADLPEVIQDGRIDIGALLCELLVVAHDPYPRNEGEEFEWSDPEHDASLNPFSALQKLKIVKDQDKS